MFSPLELLERLAVLVPRPRVNLLLYYGVLGARSAWRRRLRTAMDGRERPGATSAGAAGGNAASAARPRAMTWAALMQRTFGLDVLLCPGCGGRLRLVALVEQAAVVARILDHLGMPATIPLPRPPPKRSELLIFPMD